MDLWHVGLSLDLAEIAQRLTDGIGGSGITRTEPDGEECDVRRRRGRPNRFRPRDCTAEYCDEIAPPHPVPLRGS